jgi:hypothetical protein
VKLAGLSITAKGDIIFKDEHGAAVPVGKITREVTHNRAKGDKIRSRQMLDGGTGAVGGVHALAQYDAVYFIDTNCKVIKRKRVAVAAFIRSRIEATSSGHKVICDEERVNLYEFHGSPKKPELLAIFKLACDVRKFPDFSANSRIAIVTDTELGAHDEINERRRPIVDGHLLPQGFHLLYASADVGQEAINKLIRFCDRMARRRLADIKKGKLTDGPLREIDEDPIVRFRYLYNSGLEIVNPEVPVVVVTPGTKVQIFGRR